MRLRHWVGLVYLGLIAASFALSSALPDWSAIDIRPTNEPEIHRIVMGVTALYVILAALPFVPGAEIGFGLLAVFGGRAAFLVYIAMVAALMLAFLIGRFVPTARLQAALGALGFERARALVAECHGLDLNDRAGFLAERVPTRVLPFLLRHRYLSLAVLLNLPGNTLLGGGGGIAMVAGMSRLYGMPQFLATVCLAVAPIPVGFAFFM